MLHTLSSNVVTYRLNQESIAKGFHPSMTWNIPVDESVFGAICIRKNSALNVFESDKFAYYVPAGWNILVVHFLHQNRKWVVHSDTSFHHPYCSVWQIQPYALSVPRVSYYVDIWFHGKSNYRYWPCDSMPQQFVQSPFVPCRQFVEFDRSQSDPVCRRPALSNFLRVVSRIYQGRMREIERIFWHRKKFTVSLFDVPKWGSPFHTPIYI